jgi:hypothetical protein
MFLYYTISAAHLAVKFKDRTAMRLVILYFVRTVAWSCGAATTVGKYLAGDRGKSKK